MTSWRGGYSNANPYNALNMTTGSDSESTSGDTVDTIVAAAMASTVAKMDSMKKSNIGGKKYLVNLWGGLLPRCWFDAGLGK